MRQYSSGYIRKIFKDIQANLTRRFREEFLNDERGTQRNWVALEENQIRELSLKYENQVLGILNRFKFIELDYKSIQQPGSTLNPQETPSGPNRSMDTMNQDQLLSDEELRKVKDRFKQNVEDILDEAIRKHVSRDLFISN